MNGFDKMQLEQAVDVFIEMSKPMIRLQKEYYKEALEVGFDKEEALKTSLFYVKMNFQAKSSDE